MSGAETGNNNNSTTEQNRIKGGGELQPELCSRSAESPFDAEDANSEAGKSLNDYNLNRVHTFRTSLIYFKFLLKKKKGPAATERTNVLNTSLGRQCDHQWSQNACRWHDANTSVHTVNSSSAPKQSGGSEQCKQPRCSLI